MSRTVECQSDHCGRLGQYSYTPVGIHCFTCNEREGVDNTPYTAFAASDATG